MLMGLTYDKLQGMYDKAGYRFYDDGKFNVNLFGIRNDLAVDIFNDYIGVAYRDGYNKPQLELFVGTTDPGLYWLKNKLGNINGTFILGADQHKKCWKLGKHNNSYEALVQAAPGVFWGYRDNDSDGKLDLAGKIYRDVTGLNGHTTSHLRGMASRVGAYSAGCQVIQHVVDYLRWLSIVKRSADLYGNLFTYTLFDNTTKK